MQQDILIAFPTSPPRDIGIGAGLTGCPGGSEDDPRGEYRAAAIVPKKAAAPNVKQPPEAKAKGKAISSASSSSKGPLPLPPPLVPPPPAPTPPGGGAGGGDSDSSNDIKIAASISKSPPPPPRVKAKGMGGGIRRSARDYIVGIGGAGQACFHNCIKADGSSYENWRFRCAQPCNCERTMGLGARNIARHGVLEPLAFLHVWALMPPDAEKGHVKTHPTAAQVAAFLTDNRAQLQEIYDYFIPPAP